MLWHLHALSLIHILMQFMYLWLPLIFDVLIMFVLSRMNVEDANKKLKAEKGIAADEVTDALDIN